MLSRWVWTTSGDNVVQNDSEPEKSKVVNVVSFLGITAATKITGVDVSTAGWRKGLWWTVKETTRRELRFPVTIGICRVERREICRLTTGRSSEVRSVSLGETAPYEPWEGAVEHSGNSAVAETEPTGGSSEKGEELTVTVRKVIDEEEKISGNFQRSGIAKVEHSEAKISVESWEVFKNIAVNYNVGVVTKIEQGISGNEKGVAATGVRCIGSGESWIRKDSEKVGELTVEGSVRTIVAAEESQNYGTKAVDVLFGSIAFGCIGLTTAKHSTVNLERISIWSHGTIAVPCESGETSTSMGISAKSPAGLFQPLTTGQETSAANKEIRGTAAVEL